MFRDGRGQIAKISYNMVSYWKSEEERQTKENKTTKKMHGTVEWLGEMRLTAF